MRLASRTVRSRLIRGLLAVWMLVVGTTVSVRHTHAATAESRSHGFGLIALAPTDPTADRATSTNPHRHLVLLGVESPAQPIDAPPGRGTPDRVSPAAESEFVIPAGTDSDTTSDLASARPVGPDSPAETVRLTPATAGVPVVPICPFARHAVSGVRLI